ncbi:MAG TPA: hypothetical protein VE990_18775 [Acidimicrobiales bacterium]|nr:hypothetical protein [Acidimicrobiales bacterium]
MSEAAGPDITASPAQVAAKLSSHRSDVLVNSALHTVQGIAALILSAAVAALLASRSRHLAAYGVFGFGLTTATASLVSAVSSATAASSIHQVTDPQAPYLLYRGAQAAGMADTIFFAGLVLVFALELTRSALLPRASAPAGAVVAVIFFVGGFDYLSPDSGPLSGVRALGGVLAVLYILVTGVALLRQGAAGNPEGQPARAGTVQR